MSFFIRNNKEPGKLKRKFNGNSEGSKKFASKGKKRNVKNNKDDDESIASSDEEFAEQRNKGLEEDYDDDEEEEETAQEKRLRLAKKYLQEIEEEEKDREDFEKGGIARRLHEEYLEEKGRLKRTVASNYTGHGETIILKCKYHRETITCLCLSSDGKFLFSGSKDGTIVKWCLADKSKVKILKGKRTKNDNGIKCVECMAISTDSKFVVVGDKATKNITVLSGDDLSHIKYLQGHRGMVTGLVFRKNTHTLYSASKDASVKVWNLDDMAYVESLFGHGSAITSIDALSRERAVTSGGLDGSIRIWKIVEESQLIFNGHGGSIDTVKLINEENFLSGGDDGQLSVWGCLKKKPLCSYPEAHGKNPENGLPNWISSIATLLNTDLVASGSNSGVIRLWQCEESFRKIKPLFDVKVEGFINSLTFTPDGNYLIAAVGKEHRLGRWWHLSEPKNGIVLIPLNQKQSK
ncbi:U3 small nucleolar RNA-interacting protein 2-like isoform X2 [Leptopilina heterotoma]|uniref:U3 small nucleolar RNA-interacting protein 2-like isoform X2 n=1 Tax=Leptopilina heterotoma TaxID=63436 RepID=UPI001CA8B5D6|nr:U3 small nucleolar RNA-interacting protein 2-like isoform X2 [Leptopilina heterotoma]